MTTPVRAHTCMQFTGNGTDPHLAAIPLEVVLGYTPADPWTVTATFHTGGEPVVWLLSRELLAHGLTKRAGDGDVVIAPIPDQPGHVELCLRTNGAARFEARSSALLGFLARTYALVPVGRESEHVDIDADIAALLDTGDRR